MTKKNDSTLTDEQIRGDLRYLQLLAQSYPNIAAASTEIINLEAILNLPKPTEHYISDPHGESDAFNHVLSFINNKLNSSSFLCPNLNTYESRYHI